MVIKLIHIDDYESHLYTDSADHNLKQLHCLLNITPSDDSSINDFYIEEGLGTLYTWQIHNINSSSIEYCKSKIKKEEEGMWAMLSCEWWAHLF